MTERIMKGLPEDFPDVNKSKYWSGPKGANPDGCNYDPSHTIFFIRDYMRDVKSWYRRSGGSADK